MRLSHKLFYAALATVLASAIALGGRATAADQASDSQTIINSLVQQLNQLQNNQPNNQQTPAVSPSQPTTEPVASQQNQPAAAQNQVAPPAPVNTTPVSPQGTTLTMDNIPAFAASLGYEAKKVNDNCYSINASRTNFTLYINVYPDQAQKKLWLFAYMREIKDLSTVPAECMIKLLEANSNIGPTHFYLAKNVIYMGRAFENENVTPVRFRQEVDQFFSDCQRTEELWTVEKWPSTSAPSNAQLSSNQATPAPAP